MAGYSGFLLCFNSCHKSFHSFLFFESKEEKGVSFVLYVQWARLWNVYSKFSLCITPAEFTKPHGVFWRSWVITFTRHKHNPMKFKISKHRNTHSQLFFKIAVLKNFTILIVKHLCCSLFLINLQFHHKHTQTQVFFYEYREIFKNSFYIEPLVAASSGRHFLLVINPFHATDIFVHPLKILERLWLSVFSKGTKKAQWRKLGWS